LHVIGRRADGYHLLDSLIAFADIGDTITAAPADALAADGRWPGSGRDRRLAMTNLVFARPGCSRSAAVSRPVPRCTSRRDCRRPAGSAAGRATAAAVLRALSHLWDQQLDNEALRALALELGADVPALSCARPVWVGGIGEELQPAPSLPRQASCLPTRDGRCRPPMCSAAGRGGFRQPRGLVRCRPMRRGSWRR